MTENLLQHHELISFVDAWIDDLQSRSEGDPGLNAFIDALRNARSGADTDADLSLPDQREGVPAVIEQLDDALARLRGPAALLEHLAKVAHAVPWNQLYAGDDLEEGFSDKLVAGRIIGHPALYPSSTMIAGLFLLAPGLLYPKHDHEAEEIYQVLSGRLDVSYDLDGETITLENGAVCRQTPHRLHSLRAGDEPVLLLYLWIGNMNSPTWWLRKDAQGLWRDCWERQPDMSLKKTRTLQYDPSS